jgi:hypothetical protein
MTHSLDVVKRRRSPCSWCLWSSLFSAFAVLFIASTALAATPRDAEPPPSIAIVTMGPGDPVFSRFGHNAILVRDARRPEGIVYNFGTFSFSSPSLVSDFLQGRLSYWLSTERFPNTLQGYRRQNRSLRIQELALPPDRARELARALQKNARPENRYYRYDYYLDNCSTRVRDALDRALDGQLRAQARGPARLTYREHTRRLVEGDPLLSLGLDLGLAGFADREVTRFDEAFLPEELSRLLRDVKLPSEAGPTPLVVSETVAFEAVRTLPSELPSSRTLAHAALGLALGAVAFALGRSRERRFARVAFGMYAVLLGFIFGGVGALLAFFWTATDHFVAHQNVNLLFVPPFALLLVPFGAMTARGSASGARLLERVLLACAISALLGLLALPFVQQDCTRIAALSLSLWVTSYLGVVRRGLFSGLGVALRRLLPRPE